MDGTDTALYTDISAISVSPEATIRQAIARIDRSGKGAVVVIDESGRLMAILTDGDIVRIAEIVKESVRWLVRARLSCVRDRVRMICRHSWAVAPGNAAC